MLNNFENFSFPSIEKRWTKDKETDGQKEKRQEKTKNKKRKSKKQRKSKRKKQKQKQKNKKTISKDMKTRSGNSHSISQVCVLNYPPLSPWEVVFADKRCQGIC